MPRLKLIDPETATGKVKELYEAVTAKLGSVPNIFKGMGNSPVTLETYLTMGQVLANSQLSAQEREVIALTCSTINECKYCAAAHTMIAGMLGVSAEEAVNIRKGVSEDSKTSALIAFTRSIIETKGFVPDEQLETMRSVGYTDGQISEVVAVIAQNTFSNFFNHVNDTELDFPEAPAI